MTLKHYSVLLKETLHKLNIKEDGVYVDATLGLGGHSKEIAILASKGKVIAFDQDSYAMKESKEKLKEFRNIIFINSNFENLKTKINELGITKIDGFLFDLGPSFYQLTDGDRGFTYHGEFKLDMRMDTSQSKSAIEVINEYSEQNLVNILFKYGNEKQSKKLASKIVEERQKEKITTNTRLNEIIKNVKGWNKNKHPSKNIYQAIRIEVNREIEVLESALYQASELLKIGSTLAVISFHSLEDKITKNVFYKLKQKEIVNPMGNIKYFITHKTIYPSKEEIDKNNASRSAKLRTITKENE